MNIVIVVSVPTVMSVAIFVNKNITIDVSVAIAAKNNCCKPNFWSITVAPLIYQNGQSMTSL